MAGEVRRAPGGGPARRAAHPEMAEGRRAGGWEADTSGRGDAPRWQCLAAFGKRLSSLRVRLVGPSMASEARTRRCDRGAVCRRHRRGLQQQSGCRSVSGGTYGTNAKVQPGTASRENAVAGVRSVCDRPTAVAWRRETGDVRLSRLYAYLCEEEEQWTVYGVAADDTQEAADEAERGESRTSATDARTHPRSGQMAASGGTWAHPILRRASEPKRAVDFSVPSGAALASRAVAAQPERPRPVGSHAAPHQPLVASAFCLSSLSPAPHGRRYLRQEPDAGNPPVRIRGGGYE